MLSQSKLLPCYDDLSSHLIAKYQNTLDIISPYCLASLISCTKNFFFTNSSESRGTLVNIFLELKKMLWDIRDDVRNFSDSYNALLKVLFAKEIYKNDSDGSIKDLVLKV